MFRIRMNRNLLKFQLTRTSPSTIRCINRFKVHFIHRLTTTHIKLLRHKSWPVQTCDVTTPQYLFCVARAGLIQIDSSLSKWIMAVEDRSTLATPSSLNNCNLASLSRQLQQPLQVLTNMLLTHRYLQISIIRAISHLRGVLQSQAVPNLWETNVAGSKRIMIV